MLAMDVVDTLRHRENLVARELNEDERDRQLIERLREIYSAQGIDVTDQILAEGVTALKEQRFSYSPPGPSFSVTLAKLYVRRHVWGKAVLGIVAAVLIAWGPGTGLSPCRPRTGRKPARSSTPRHCRSSSTTCAPELNRIRKLPKPQKWPARSTRTA